MPILYNFNNLDEYINKYDSRIKYYKRTNKALDEIELIDIEIENFKIIRDKKTSLSHKSNYNGIIAYLKQKKKQLKNDNGQNPIIKESNTEHKKLTWNENNNILIDIFYQLHEIENEKGRKVLPSSLKQIAIFLKNNFECFNSTSVDTIYDSLKPSKAHNRPVENKRIFIKLTKE